MIELRSYQITSISDVRTQFQIGHKRVVLQGSTGSGKTVIFSYMVKQAADRGHKCLILTNRVELLEQAGGTFDRIGIEYENITADTRTIPTALVLVAMIETMKRRAKARLDFVMLLRQVTMCIIDECHIQSFDEIFQYLSPECYVIGATATPIRTNAKHPLSAHFTQLITGPSITSLIDQSFLSAPEYYGVGINLSSVHINAGEFDENDMTELYGQRKIFEGLKHNLSKHAPGLKTMIFCPSVASSIKVAQKLDCLHVDGTMSSGERGYILSAFETTPGAIITNCAITTTGYDCPDIECIVLYRATTSLPLYLQMIGRGSRTTATKNRFLILDFGMNVQRFGFWHIDRKWSLDPPKKKSRKTKDVFPIKFCPECGAIVSVNTKTCEYCGYIWPMTEKERVFAELEKLTYAEIQRKIRQAGSVEEIEQIRIAKGYKVGWALHQFKTTDQLNEYAQLKHYHPKWVDRQIEKFFPKATT